MEVIMRSRLTLGLGSPEETLLGFEDGGKYTVLICCGNENVSDRVRTGAAQEQTNVTYRERFTYCTLGCARTRRSAFRRVDTHSHPGLDRWWGSISK